MFELWVYKDGGRNDLARAAIDVNVSHSLDQLGASLTFTLPWSDIAGNNTISPELGDTVSLVSYTGGGGGMIFTGVVTETENTPEQRKYTCHDFCWYLNKTKVTLQFSGISVTEAIRELWNECGITARSMANIETTVDETCYCETPSGILNKLLTLAEDDTGRKYYAYVEQGNQHAVNIEEVGSVKSRYTLSEIVSPSLKRSLEDVVNHAVYVSGDSSGYYETGVSAEDAESIAKYGRITDLIIAEEEDISAQKIVENRVRLNATPKATVTVECAGAWFPRPGRRIALTERTVGASGDWVVESVSHTINGGEHRTKLTLTEYLNIMPYEEAVAEEVAEEKATDLIQGITGNGTKPPKNYDGLAGDRYYVKAE